jgi:hypothetical protein
MMKVFKTRGTITALSPIHHGGDEKTGSTPLLRTITIYDPRAKDYHNIPFISGNSVRGRLRRLLMATFLDQIGFEVTNPKLYHALFSGGLLESTDEETGYIDLELRRQIAKFLPPVALFGTTFGNQMVTGRLIVEHMFPICQELAGLLELEGESLPPIRTLTEFSFITRRDELRLQREEGEQAVQMKVDYLCFVPGTTFRHGFMIVQTNPILEGALGQAIALWKEVPFIGGRSASGDGKIKLEYEPEPDPTPYIDFVAEHAQEARELLREMEAKL